MDGAAHTGGTVRKRLIYAASRRSLLELEQILARFLEREVDSLSEKDCEGMLKLLLFTDLDLLNWVLDVTEPPPEVDTGLLARLRRCR